MTDDGANPSHDTPAMDAVVGGKYRLTRVMGRGGMGAVCEARHVVIQRRFAIKFLRRELAADSVMMERFRSEAITAGRLEDENIAAAADFGQTDDGLPFIVMEYLEGEDLAQLIAREGMLPVPRAVHIAIQACRGLDAAHKAGVIHRDLKPENLFICQRGDGSDLVKILDFGIAKLRPEADGASPTKTGITMGTPAYMSIEQARGAKDVDWRTDIYSLGVILYEALAAQKPHPGDSYNQVLFHILTQPPQPLAHLRPGLPPSLEEVVQKAMAVEPEDRFQSASEFAAALAPFAGRSVTPLRSDAVIPVARSSDTTPLPTRQSTSPTPDLSAVSPAATGQLDPPLAPKGWPLWAFAVVALLAVIAGLYLFRPKQTEPAASNAPSASSLVSMPSLPPPSSAPSPQASADPSPAEVDSAGRPPRMVRRPPTAGTSASSGQPPAPSAPRKLDYDRNNPYD